MVRLKGKFEGWTIDEINELVYDDGNNKYSIGEIRSLFYVTQLQGTILGSQYEIKSLKKILEEKIKNVPTPTITVDWGDGTEQKIKHPSYG